MRKAFYWKRNSIITACFVMVVCPLMLGHAFGKESNNIEETNYLVKKGFALSKQKARELEGSLKSNPNNLEVRTQLLGYYYVSMIQSSEAKESHQKHLLWVISNNPESEIAGLPFGQLPPETDKTILYKGKQLWLRQVEDNKNNPKIIGNAASFFLLHDLDESERLFKEAKSLEPNNSKWSWWLGEVYKLKALNAKTPKAKQRIEGESLKEQELVLKKTADQKKRFYMLAGTANSAFESNEIERATLYATELLRMAPNYKNDKYYGSALHLGNIILGRIALKEGNIEQAKILLLKAGETPGSPQISMFGPNMTLALELLERGEKKTVVEYLKLCDVFWKGGNRIDNWIQDIEVGKTPEQMEFRAENSYY